jgi:phosphomannomutase
MVAGLSYYGKTVTVFGVTPTPALAFLTRESGFNAGVMLTASHNPAEYVGIKIFDNKGVEISLDKEKEIENLILQYDEKTTTKNLGEIKFDQTGSWRYIDKITSTLQISGRRLTVLLDCGNGAASTFTSTALSQLGHKVLTINCHPSSSSLGRTLEPNAHSLQETAKIAKALDVDIAIAHDGDGDRVVLIDEKGQILEDQTLSMLALLTISTKGVAAISINTSQSVEKLAEKLGFKVLRARLGKTFLEMKWKNGVFATEPSKVTDASWGIWEDGVYIAAKIVQYISASSNSLSEIVNTLPRNTYYQRNILVNKIDRQSLEQNILKKYSEETIEKLDGWKIIFKDESFLLFRVSGTEPKARVYADSSSEKRAAELLNEGVTLIETCTTTGE